MHIDARTLPNGSVLEADLCIVGAGAAGITMALEWSGPRHKVLLLEGGGPDYGAGDWQRRDPTLIPLPLDPRVMWTKMWQFSPPTRFGARYRPAAIGAPNVHLYTHANVCELEPNESLRSIEGLRVRTLDGKEHRALARHYVLACCSIQNARLLLASNR